MILLEIKVMKIHAGLNSSWYFLLFLDFFFVFYLRIAYRLLQIDLLSSMLCYDIP